MENNNIWLVIIDVIYKLAAIATLGFMAFQLKQTSDSSKLANDEFANKKKEDSIRHQKDEREKAINMAEIYADELVLNISYLSYVYKECGVNKYFKGVSFNDLTEFDIFELENIIKGKITIDELKNITKSIDLKVLVAASGFLKRDSEEKVEKHLEVLRAITEFEEIETFEQAALTSDIVEENKFEEKCKIVRSRYKRYELVYNTEFQDILCSTLNKLEYFCMYFNAGIADEEIVYQSLHQSFLEMVKVVYFRIAILNKSGKDKYYTNIIELYNKWTKRYMELEEKEIESQRNCRQKVKPIEK